MVKKHKKNLSQFVILVLIMIFVFASLLFSNKFSDEKKRTKDNYNGFQFFYDENQKLWFTQIQIGNTPYNIPFYHHPIDLEEIIVEERVEDIILKQRPNNIIIAIPGNSSSKMALAGIEIAKITGERFNLLMIPTTSAVNEQIKGLPFVTCKDANKNTVVISFHKSDKNAITSNNRCIILEFKNDESIMVADAFSYHLLKII